jgi:hypothetical protein
VSPSVSPAEEHRRVAALFTERVRGTPPAAWDAPAPPEGWTARDVVRHLVEWFPAFLEAGAGVRLPSGPSVDDDPVAAWRVHSDGVQALLDDPATATRTLSNPHVGDLPLDEVLRASGHYGPRVAVPADADVQTRLIAFTGRDPRRDP